MHCCIALSSIKILKKNYNSCSKDTLLLVVCTWNVAHMSASTAKPILFYLGAIIDYERVFKPHGLTFLGTAGVGVLSI